MSAFLRIPFYVTTLLIHINSKYYTPDSEKIHKKTRIISHALSADDSFCPLLCGGNDPGAVRGRGRTAAAGQRERRAAKCSVIARPVGKLVAAIRFSHKKRRIPTPVTRVTGSE
jgi:hypothetical protein